ncbi:hypothetical protein [Kineosporia succinea]|uniref:Uncharacterized protein n=1 Tax=Kineosporia succinea TaxID=84632 RepID=A0ABT9PE27_9ACTN|nr:hypothetical protein [Kineosporia succinea]MDP9830952.1 hypothetical protein [Kineosporia succinea]
MEPEHREAALADITAQLTRKGPTRVRFSSPESTPAAEIRAELEALHRRGRRERVRAELEALRREGLRALLGDEPMLGDKP